MQLEHTQSMNDVFCRVMESLAFYFVDPIDPHTIDIQRDMAVPYRKVSMRFEGPHVGNVILYLPQSAFSTIWANMLGVDEADPQSQEQQNDATCEILNVICGQLLTEIWGTDPVFDLCIPDMQDIDSANLSDVLTHPSTCSFNSDDGLILLEMIVDQTS